MEEFFSHENHDAPPSLAEHEQLKKPSSKSDFLKCLNLYANSIAEVTDNYEAPTVDAYVIDGPAFVQNPHCAAGRCCV